jgi:hypothetical protein
MQMEFQVFMERDLLDPSPGRGGMFNRAHIILLLVSLIRRAETISFAS